MSIEQAQAFFEKVQNDEDLAKRLGEAQDSESKLEIARQEGFEFELEDAKIATEALTDDDLARMAAGSEPWQEKLIDASKNYRDQVIPNCKFYG